VLVNRNPAQPVVSLTPSRQGTQTISPTNIPRESTTPHLTKTPTPKPSVTSTTAPSKNPLPTATPNANPTPLPTSTPTPLPTSTPTPTPTATPNQQLIITSVSPASLKFGNQMRIYGSNFIVNGNIKVQSIKVGPVSWTPATATNIQDSGTIITSMQCSYVGTWDVTVTSTDGTVSTLPNAVTITP
jgi:hypothetical protein